MSSEATIIMQIEKTVEGKYREWKIGLTDDPARRKAQLGHPLNWLQWKSDSEEAARNVEHYFLQKGMKSARGAAKSANYIYILIDGDL
ncbi:MAG: hypothetical protein ACE5HX_12080 [bacterium]